MKHIDIDLLALHTQIEPIIRKVGKLQQSLFRSDKLEIQQKSVGSYVCNADLESEKILKDELHKLIGQADFFAEESGESGKGPYHWVIDPLDGTTNYIHGIPYFGISVALTYNYEPIWGAVFNPIADDFFYAVKNYGAYLNGLRLSIEESEQFNKTMIVIGLPYTKNAGYMKILKHLPDIAVRSYAFRHLGAAALDQAYLARGGLDVIFFPRLGWWDIAAGMLLIKEAGGIITDFQGGTVTKDYYSYLAGSRAAHKELLEILKNSSS